MGKTADDTRRKIEEERDALSDTLQELRVRGRRARRVGIRVAVIATGVSAVTGASIASVIIVVRRRDAGPLTRGSKRLPFPARGMAVPPARSADRWLERRSKGIRRRRDELMDEIALRVAQQYAGLERRRNPWWQSTLSGAAKAGATAAAGALVHGLLQPGTPADPHGNGEVGVEYRGSPAVGAVAG